MNFSALPLSSPGLYISNLATKKSARWLLVFPLEVAGTIVDFILVQTEGKVIFGLTASSKELVWEGTKSGAVVLTLSMQSL